MQAALKYFSLKKKQDWRDKHNKTESWIFF